MEEKPSLPIKTKIAAWWMKEKAIAKISLRLQNKIRETHRGPTSINL
jgi:hydroxylamine reductase (hybrid-cluster protein)